MYTHPTCLIRRQQWHNKSWRLPSLLAGRVRQTDRPSNAFIIILNHIFSSLPNPCFHSASFEVPPLPPSVLVASLQFTAISLYLSLSSFYSLPHAVVLRI